MRTPATTTTFLPMRRFAAFVKRTANDDQLNLLREFREWIKTLPR